MLSRAFFNEKVLIRVSRNCTANIRTLASSSSSSSSNNHDPPRLPSRTPKAFQQAPTKKGRSRKAKAPHVITKEGDIGPMASATLEYVKRREGFDNLQHPSETMMRAADYVTSDLGTTEDLVGQRRAMMDIWDPEDAKTFQTRLDEIIQHESARSFKDLSWVEEEDGKNLQQPKGSVNEDDGDSEEDPNQVAFGPWSETIVRVDRVQKVQRGGTMVRYRALVIGGNLNGCAGFGVAKANAPNEASAIASRIAKRNVFFIDRYNGTGLTADLAGKQNSCKVLLRSVNPNKGLHGHPLIMEILKYFGITDCTAKSHGNRNVHNVVRATFKAIMTHESLEDVALKRGKRLLNLERAKRLKI